MWIPCPSPNLRPEQTSYAKEKPALCDARRSMQRRNIHISGASRRLRRHGSWIKCPLGFALCSRSSDIDMPKRPSIPGTGARFQKIGFERPRIVKAKVGEESDSSNGRHEKTSLHESSSNAETGQGGSDLEMWSEHGAGILCRVATPDKITAKRMQNNGNNAR
jgi:hypothetical protein